MKMKTKKELIAFEDWCVETYKQGKLRSPIHLSGGNEEQLIKIFEKVKADDWIFTTYRSHYHALLKGVPEDWLKQWILNNKSIHVMNKEFKIVTSAIVGGTLPQALGAALAIKRKNESRHAWAFCGDMAGLTGGFRECWQYAVNFDLPITFVIEDNGLSTDTNTKEAWGFKKENDAWYSYANKIIYYKYKRTHPHYGVGQWIKFKEEGLKQDGTNF